MYIVLYTQSKKIKASLEKRVAPTLEFSASSGVVSGR